LELSFRGEALSTAGFLPARFSESPDGCAADDLMASAATASMGVGTPRAAMNVVSGDRAGLRVRHD